MSLTQQQKNWGLPSQSSNKNYDDEHTQRKRMCSLLESETLEKIIDYLDKRGPCVPAITLPGKSWPNHFKNYFYQDYRIPQYGVEANARRARALRYSKTLNKESLTEQDFLPYIFGDSRCSLVEGLQAFRLLDIPIQVIDADLCATLVRSQYSTVCEMVKLGYRPELGLLFLATFACGDPKTGRGAIRTIFPGTSYKATLSSINTILDKVERKLDVCGRLVFEYYYKDNKQGMLRVALFFPATSKARSDYMNWKFWEGSDVPQAMAHKTIKVDRALRNIPGYRKLKVT